VNKTCDNHALGLLALCYLPGVIAAYVQVIVYDYTSISYIGLFQQLHFFSSQGEQNIPLFLSGSINGCE